jgi:predicted O-methyltransferase YrrM
MKDALDNILRSEQAAYLEALHGRGSPAKWDPLFARMEARAAERGYPISDPEVAMFLTVAARAARPRFIVELGTNIGYGAIILARAAEEARIVSIEYRSDLCEEARAFIAEAGLSSRIEVRNGLALAELEKIEVPIDLLYIDCVKEEYPRYLELGIPKLSERGLLIADNALWKGLAARESEPEDQRASTQGVRAFNLALVQDPRLTGVVLPLGDGVGFAVRR